MYILRDISPIYTIHVHILCMHTYIHIHVCVYVYMGKTKTRVPGGKFDQKLELRSS